MRPPARSRPHFGEEWLVAVLDSLSEGVVALADDGTIRAANPAAERLLGFRIGDHRGDGWERLAWRTLTDLDGTPVAPDEHPVAIVLRDRMPGRSVLVGLPGDASPTTWLSLATHVLGHGSDRSMRGVVVSFEDATDRVEAEQGRQRLIAVLREVMSSTSHDFRSPLAVILNLGRMLQESWDDISDADRLEWLATITRQAAKLDRLVMDLSLMSRLEGEALVAETRTVPIGDIVEATLDEITDASLVDVDVDSQVTVEVDPDHGRRMLVNLVENAIKYGDPPIRIESSASDEEIQLSVTDHGPGVPPELAPRLFDRFSRGSQRPVSGMGLGLAIVERLARLNGAEIRYDAGWTDGARFVLGLPRSS